MVPNRLLATTKGLLSACSIALVIACGPALELEPLAQGNTDADTDADTGDSGASTDAEVSTTDAHGKDSTSGSAAGLEDGGTEQASESDDRPTDEGCGCEESATVGLDEAFGDYSAASVLASLQTPAIDWIWLEFADSPTETTLHIAIDYADGPVMRGPGGNDGCGFLYVPCPSTLLIPVVLTVTTTDGWLAASIPATIDVDTDRDALSVTLAASAEAAELGGTFTEQVVPGLEGSPTNIGFIGTWDLDGAWQDAHLAGDTPQGDGLLGRAL
ncbi:MAG: hypothetical protein JKY37_28170 [Nannocystaceae bacterium]|nr:hypothetical protein [Nannocystaceae bacterium]